MLHDYDRLDLAQPLDCEDDTAQYKAVFGDDVAERRPFLHIGAGDWHHPLWRNLDCVQPPYDRFTAPDYNVDLSEMSRWPIDAGTMHLLYSSHTLEHLTDEIVDHVLREAFRGLALGGIFRIVVPDIITAYWAYRLKDAHYYDERNRSGLAKGRTVLRATKGHARCENVATSFFLRFASCFGRRAAFDGVGAAAKVDEVFSRTRVAEGCEEFLRRADMSRKKPHLHINWFSAEKLQAMLEAVGFNHVVRTSYGQSVSPLMRNKAYFDRTRPSESLYVDAIKI